ncbi:MAG: DUF1501 domain-containing protein [Planctomycetota bacterium]
MTPRPAHPQRPGVRYATSRRELLQRSAHGFGALAFSLLFGDAARGGNGARRAGLGDGPGDGLGEGAALSALHHTARAERVIFLYMDGGPSQVDTFDPKPRLRAEHGQKIGMQIPKTQFDDVGNVLGSYWDFRPGGACGTPVSDLFPYVRDQADKLCVIRSMVSKFPEHTAANYFLHTGHNPAGRPSMGAWATYGLGALARDLPGFVVIDGGLIPPGGLECFGAGFLSPRFQGSIFRAERGVPNTTPLLTAEREAARRALVRSLEGARAFEDRQVEAAIHNAELAFAMQAAVPELIDVSGESDATRALYGFDAEYEPTRGYARQCLLARRLVERGVRFVEVTCRGVGHDRWDQHSGLQKGHADNARAVDQPIAGLLADLESRGLLDSTLVVFAGEFGRTPMSQGADGRDHNPHGFSIWLAGGGAKPGHVHGATDDYGYFAVEDKVSVYDLHATMLHLLGVDHTRLTYPFSGRDMRLTDVHGEVVRGVLA